MKPNPFFSPFAAGLMIGCVVAPWGAAVTASAAVVTAPDSWVLYDGHQQAVTPDNFSPQRLAFAGIGVTQSYEPETGATRLTTSESDRAGYSNFLGPIAVGDPTIRLDRHRGYEVAWALEILQESHGGNPQRAGFSLLVVGDDVAAGVPSSLELGFQTGRIFAQAQDPLFGAPSAAETSFDPVGVGFVDYRLRVLGDAFRLYADQEMVMTGELQDYSGFSGPLNPYQTPNRLFLGDNTTSAGADIRLRSVTVTAIPEASGAIRWGAMTLCAVGVIRGRRRRRVS